MPAYCAVPFCKSTKGKTKGVAFHEFPSNTIIRQQWMKAISKEGKERGSCFEPSGHTLVCSVHFQESDYRQGLKIRKLKPTAVPTVFPHYPSYLIQPPKKKQRIVQKVASNVEFCSVLSPVPLQMFDQDNIPHTSRCVLSPDTVQMCDQENIPPTPSFANPPSEKAKNVVVLEEHSLEKLRQSKAQLENKIKQLSRDVNNFRKTVDRRNKTLQRLQGRVDNMQSELDEVKKNPFNKAFEKLFNEANEGNTSAQFLVEQVLNFSKKTPRYGETTLRECIAWRLKSTKGYEHARRRGMLRLPSRTTLKRYIGTSTAETGITPLVKQRLLTEVQQLQPEEKFGSLIIDEMAINEKVSYDKDLDRCFGYVELGDNFMNSDHKLADHLLCFILEGLSTSYSIPVAYFFTRSISGKDLHRLAMDVIINVELCGFEVVRIVTDNIRANTTMFRIFGKGILKPSVPHPLDSSRFLFLSFDPSHVLKNLWVQFLNREMYHKASVISSKYLKKLVEIQQGMVFKPVRFLKRIHIDPTNFQKMRVYPAVQVFSPPVTATLETLRDNPLCHQEAPFFEDCTVTIDLMKSYYKWFRMHNVSNRSRYISSRDSNIMHFFSLNDQRLLWLRSTFLLYLNEIRKESLVNGKEFLTTETFEALIQTSQATVACIQYLLKRGFAFVFTRNFSSDPIEKFYGALRQMCGGNDIVDMRAAIFAIEGVLKAGIATATKEKPLVVMTRDLTTTATTPEILPDEIVKMLHPLELCCEWTPPPVTTIKNLSLTVIGGYLTRVIEEHVVCLECKELLLTPECGGPLFALIKNQNRGGLRYPKPSFVWVLGILQDFCEKAVPKMNLRKQGVLQRLEDVILPYAMKSKVLTCSIGELSENHNKELCQLVIQKFVRPMLKNYATVKSAQAKKFTAQNKPTSRKVLKL